MLPKVIMGAIGIGMMYLFAIYLAIFGHSTEIIKLENDEVVEEKVSPWAMVFILVVSGKLKLKFFWGKKKTWNFINFEVLSIRCSEQWNSLWIEQKKNVCPLHILMKFYLTKIQIHKLPNKIHLIQLYIN